MTPGDRLTLTAEKPVAGGRMLARHEGAVVLVSGAIPGETVECEIVKVQRGTAWARMLRVIEADADRVDPGPDWSCGGSVLSHVRYERQLALKRDILRDAFARIGGTSVDDDFPIADSPVAGYRMRARLHVRNGRIGFFREGTHQLCEAATTRQLLPSSIDALSRLADALRAIPRADVSEVELTENIPADERAVHLVPRDDTDPSPLGVLPQLEGVTGVSCGAARPLVLWGVAEVSDTIPVTGARGTYDLTLSRQAHAFFQGNRYLLGTLVSAVVDEVPAGQALDLYAGVGLFSVALARRGDTEVIAVEGDRTSANDLKRNAARVAGAIEPRHQPVEACLAAWRSKPPRTIVVDPPRTGMTRAALQGAIALRATRLVYVSCDVATLARDTRTLNEAGYRMSRVRAFDLFPNTAHVETLAVFER